MKSWGDRIMEWPCYAFVGSVVLMGAILAKEWMDKSNQKGKMK